MHFDLLYLHKEVWAKMAYMRKQYEAAFKARVALEAGKREKMVTTGRSSMQLEKASLLSIL